MGHGSVKLWMCTSLCVFSSVELYAKKHLKLHRLIVNMVLKFISPAICIVAGSSSSGKSTLMFNILKHSDTMFTESPVKIIYAYGAWQKFFEEIQQCNSNIEFFDGLPNKQDLESWSLDGNHRILILDDLMTVAEQDKNTLDLFTKHSHHTNFSVFFLVQNLFSVGKYFRTISLQCHYFILFKNRRDEQQMHSFGRQLFPTNTHYFIDAYKKATQEPYSYLLVDISPHSNPEYSLRSKILPGQLVSVFVPKKKMNSLIRKEKYFMILLLSTERKQQLALVKSITKRQLQAIVQIVYNITHDFRKLPENDKKKLRVHRYKSVIRHFIAKRVSSKKRISLLAKHLKHFILVLKPILKDLY